MYVDIVPNRNSRPAILLRESVREGKRIVRRTIANLSALSREQAEATRAVLKGEPLAPVDALFEIVRSRAHGAVQAIGRAMQRLHLGPLLDAKPSRERDLVLAMIAARVLDPQSKLATSRSWQHSTLGEWFGVADADENELHAALDWLLERQDAIERRMAQRHLSEGRRVLYDLSSSYMEGSACPLAQRGYSRDGKKGKLQVNYGLLTDARGCPVSLSVFAGNTADPETLLEQVDILQGRFALESVIVVGDRGMISQKQIEALNARSGVDWITALKSGEIRAPTRRANGPAAPACSFLFRWLRIFSITVRFSLQAIIRDVSPKGRAGLRIDAAPFRTSASRPDAACHPCPLTPRSGSARDPDGR